MIALHDLPTASSKRARGRPLLVQMGVRRDASRALTAHLATLQLPTNLWSIQVSMASWASKYPSARFLPLRRYVGEFIGSPRGSCRIDRDRHALRPFSFIGSIGRIVPNPASNFKG